jgi:hypothetical protein
MKNIGEWSEREKLLRKAIQARPADLRGKSMLLVDDLIQSASTFRRAAEVLLKALRIGIVPQTEIGEDTPERSSASRRPNQLAQTELLLRRAWTCRFPVL